MGQALPPATDFFTLPHGSGYCVTLLDMARFCLVATLALMLFVWLAREVTRGDAMRLDTPIRNAVHAGPRRRSPP